MDKSVLMSVCSLTRVQWRLAQPRFLRVGWGGVQGRQWLLVN